MNTLAVRVRKLLVHRILGLDDTPHRIAWGVLLGAVIAFTPTIGLQIAIYVAVATVLRANKISGIPILFVSNPFTAVPMYYSVWRVGSALVPGERMSAEAMRRQLRRLTRAEVEWADLVDADFWAAMGRTLADMGLELWVGGIVVGLIVGVPLYFVSYWGVMEYRRRTWRPARRL
jgi:uncharacterized protein